jgi:hypothetical protein
MTGIISLLGGLVAETSAVQAMTETVDKPAAAGNDKEKHSTALALASD